MTMMLGTVIIQSSALRTVKMNCFHDKVASDEEAGHLDDAMDNMYSCSYN